MTRTRIILLIIALVVVLLLVARETGVVRLNASVNAFNTSQSAHHTRTHAGEAQPLSYDITLTRAGKTWMEHRRIILGSPRVHIDGELTDITYTGNDWLPLYKSFTMTYQCDFTTPADEESHTVKGSISGEVQARLTGPTTRREARRLALEEAKKQIREYILKLNL
jgi:hypothetical protein